MNKKTISLILLAAFILTALIAGVNLFLEDTGSINNETGSLNITDSKTNEIKTVKYESAGKCVDVIDGDTIQVYGVGKVRLVQVDTPEKGAQKYTEAKKFVEEKCLGKTVYLDIDDKQKEDKYGRILAIVYTNTTDVNKEIIDSNLANISYFEPSEFKKGEI
jgi:micrococcal nuclease